MWAAILKTSAVPGLKVYTFSTRAKNKNKIKAHEQKVISASLFCTGKDNGLAFIVNQK